MLRNVNRTTPTVNTVILNEVLSLNAQESAVWFYEMNRKDHPQ